MFAFWIAVLGMAVAIVVSAPEMEGAREGGLGTEYEEACSEVYTVEGRFRVCGPPWCDPRHPGVCVTPMPSPLPQGSVTGHQGDGEQS